MLKRGSILTLILAAVLTGLVYIVILITPEPPSESLEECRIAIAEARKQGAEKYAPDLFTAASSANRQAIEFWETENTRFILFRDYSSTDSCCKLAIKLARQAIVKSQASSKNLEVSLGARLFQMQSLVDRYTRLMAFIPVPGKTRKMFLNGKMELSEAKGKFEKKQFIEGDEKARSADQNLVKSVNELKALLENYFKSYPDWLAWYHESVEHSKKTHTNLIVIDKMARICKLYKNGKVKKTYSIELGKNWIGEKRQQGDKSTPEGRYQIVKKLENSHTKYYKALLLNYPNEDDRQRFALDKKNGILPSNAQIGGLIEIHGNGGQGADWTDGCIALNDDDMKELYSLTSLSTPVTIVGSLVALKTLLNN